MLIRFFRKAEPKPEMTNSDEIRAAYKRNRISVMLSITFGYAIFYTARLPLAVVKKPLIDEELFSASELGIIGSGIFWGYAVGKCINGFLADHANLRRFFAFGLLASAIINFTMGLTASLWLWTILWLLNGWFQGFGAPSAAVALSNWFSKKQRGGFYGIWSSSHSIGELLTYVGTTALVVSLGWRAGFIGPGLWCAAVAIVLFFTMRERPEALGLPKVDEWTAREEQRPLEEEPKKPNEKKLTTRQLQFQVLRTPALWVLGLASACMYFTRYAIDSWGLFYLQEAKGYTLTQAGWIMGLNTMAGIVGCIAYGFISDRLFAGRRPPLTLIFGLFEVLALCAIFFIPPGYPGWERAAFILYGFTLSGLLATLGGLFAIDIAPKATAGAAMGMIGVFSYVSAAIQEHVSGYLIEDGMTMVDSVRVYDFSSVIVLWIGASVLSVVLASTLWRVKVQA